MILEEHLPKHPPIGDVATELGMCRLIVDRMIHKVDDHFRYMYPDATETVDIYVTTFQEIIIEDVNSVNKQMLTIATVTAEAYSVCTSPECGEELRHELMRDIVKMIIETPDEVFKECMAKGKVVGQSMN